jgi:hypothetical protein
MIIILFRLIINFLMQIDIVNQQPDSSNLLSPIEGKYQDLLMISYSFQNRS